MFYCNRYCSLLQQRTKVIFKIFFHDVMRGSNLLVNIQMRGMIKEEEKRNRSPSVLISEGGEKRGSRYMNVKRGGKERIERHNRTRGSWRAEEGDLIQKGSLLLKERGKKEQEKSSFSPPGRSVKPNQRLAWQHGSSPRHRLTMEVILGRHTSHFQSASSRTALRARGPRGGTTMLLKKYLNSYYIKKETTW